MNIKVNGKGEYDENGIYELVWNGSWHFNAQNKKYYHELTDNYINNQHRLITHKYSFTHNRCVILTMEQHRSVVYKLKLLRLRDFLDREFRIKDKQFNSIVNTLSNPAETL